MIKLNVVICDDETILLEKCSCYLEKLALEHQVDLHLKAFADGKACLQYLKNNSVDVIFLDIFLGDMLGTELATQIRDFDENVKIVFLTTSNEFAAESFMVCASHYLLKPVSEEKLMQALKRCDVFNKENVLEIDTGHRNFSIASKNLIAVEVKDKYCFFYTLNGVVRELGSISKVRECLPESNFITVHRSFIINLEHVESLEDCSFIMKNGLEVPIRIKAVKQIKSLYLDWMFKSI